MPKASTSKPKSTEERANDPAFQKWSSPIPEDRWRGFRKTHRGVEAFKSLDNFEKAEVSELEHCMADHELKALGEILKKGKKDAIEVFVRTHGANPLSDPEGHVNIPIGVAKADIVNLSHQPTAEANSSILNGEVVYVLFQAGEASRFSRGPMFNLSPVEVSRELAKELNLQPNLSEIDEAAKSIPNNNVSDFIVNAPLGPKQPVLIRAGLRRIINQEIKEGRIKKEEATAKYKEALSKQKILFFMGRRGGVQEAHDKAVRETYKYYGFNPQNLVTVYQELVHGITVDKDGKVTLMETDDATDAAGHLYAFLQAVRPGDFTTYTESGRIVKPMELDGLAYLTSRGGKYISIIRINDMDRHTTEIVNAKAFSYALKKFNEGFFNVIEGVENPQGTKGGTGTTFGDPEVHVLTETHENSYPVLSRAFDEAMSKYLEESNDRHPAYNAMRQWADLTQTRHVLREFGARLVFVPRQKNITGKLLTYLGVDMPMGDLSLFVGHYKSRMFQLESKNGKGLHIHDMKKRENLPIALRSILKQVKDPNVIAAATELLTDADVPFDGIISDEIYGAPTPEFD